MSCKPGDLAIIVRPWVIDEDIGRPVVVVRRAYLGEQMKMRNGGITMVDGHASWLCDTAGPAFPCFVADMCLRPIKGKPVEDEILRIASKPCDIKTPEAA